MLPGGVQRRARTSSAEEGADVFGGNKVTEKDAVRTAVKYAQEKGWRTAEYTVASVKKRSGKYVVSFEGAKGREGDFFWVEVDEKTGKAVRLVPGK